jgi:hypothetical protein
MVIQCEELSLRGRVRCASRAGGMVGHELSLIRRGVRDRHVRVALVHAVLAVAARPIHPGERNTAA